MRERLSEVHRFWFGDFESDLEVIRQQGTLWFGKSDQVDQTIRKNFSDLIETVLRSNLASHGLRPHLQLAVILLLDQFTRNIFRNDPRSFAADPVARQLARDLLEMGGSGLRPIEKVFLYLPFEHSEELDDQKKSVELYRQLQESVAEPMREAFGDFYDYALRHYDIIARFGRFPHRNKILERNSTAEEIEFLTQPGSSF